jgi:tRNA (guanine-N7-)-methyltransferase
MPRNRLDRAPIVYPASFDLGAYRRIIVEVGPGRGDFLFYLSEKNPDAAVVGIEIKPRRADKIMRRVERLGLKNILVIEQDARMAIRSFFERSSCDEIHINFPDPWPKRRHARHRAVSESFLADCQAALKPGGAIFFATDDEEYASAVRKTAEKVDGIAACEPDQVKFPTFFLQKWQAMGRTISYQKYVKVT